MLTLAVVQWNLIFNLEIWLNVTWNTAVQYVYLYIRIPPAGHDVRKKWLLCESGIFALVFL